MLLSAESMANLVERLKGYRFTGIYSPEGEAVVGEQFMEFYPDPDALTALVVVSVRGWLSTRMWG